MKKKSEQKERVAGAIFRRIQQLQLQWANFMSARIGKYSLATQKRGFMVCGLVLGAYCLYLVIEGFSPKTTREVHGFQVISIPKLQQQDTSDSGSADSLIIVTLRDFQQTRDSLMRNDPAQWQWIVEYRPGLLDSIRQLEMYIRDRQGPLP